MKMQEVMKAELQKAVEECRNQNVRGAGVAYTNLVGSMTEALVKEAVGAGVNDLELTAICATFGTAHKILRDIQKSEEDRLVADLLTERVYSRTRTVAIRKEVEE